MILAVLYVVGGIGLLYYGAEALVRGAAALAVRARMSPLLVGLTVVSFGTSAPELVVSVQAALGGEGGIAVGNVVGSNICNIGLILGLAALVRPLRVDAQLVRLDIPLMVGVSVVLAALLWNRTLGTAEGAALFAGMIGYVLFSLRVARRRTDGVVDDVPTPVGSVWRDVGLVGLGLGLLVLGSEGIVTGGVRIAEALGVSQTIIGLSLVALGTSLPELATSTLAAFRGEGDLAIGNVVGSNLFNALGILGVAALVHPLSAPGLAVTDLGMLLAMAALMLPLAWSGYALSRAEGGVLLLLYAGYVVLLFGTV